MVTRASDQLTIKHSVPWLPPPVQLGKTAHRTQENVSIARWPASDKRIFQLEDLHKARYVGRGTERPCCLQEHHSGHIFTCPPIQKTFKSHPFKVLWWLYYIVKAKLWPLVTDSTSSPSLLPTSQGRDWIFLHPNHVGGSPGNQPSSLGPFQKSCY